MGLTKEKKIPQRTHSTKATALCDKAYGKTRYKRNSERGMHRARTFYAVEQNTVASLARNIRKDKHQNQKPEHDERHHNTGGSTCLSGTSQIVPASQKKRPYTYTGCKP